MSDKNEPRVLLLDIETLPNTVTSWGLKVDGYLSHDNILEERSIVCASWKWLGGGQVHSASVLTHRSKDKEIPDLGVLRKLHGVMSEADCLVAHNGDRFDVPWIMARMVLTDLPPLRPVPTIDTKKIAKSRFLFNSNRLDYLGKYLKVGRKIETDFGLWLEAMKGSRKAIEKMVVYNREDVRLLERVYLKLRPYVPARLNMSHWSNDNRACPSCGEAALESRGIGMNRVSTYRRMQCRACRAWSSMPMNSKVAR